MRPRCIQILFVNSEQLVNTNRWSFALSWAAKVELRQYGETMLDLAILDYDGALCIWPERIGSMKAVSGEQS
jgi:hypothetical protein